MASDMFLDIEGIKGESQKKGFEGKMEILSWSWGAHNTGSFAVGSGGGTGKASVNDLTVTKYVDAGSPELMGRCCSLKHAPKAKLVVRKAGDKPMDYYTIELEDVVVTSYQVGGSSASDDLLTESVSLNFGKVTVKYKKQEKSGEAGSETPKTFDIAKNEVT